MILKNHLSVFLCGKRNLGKTFFFIEEGRKRNINVSSIYVRMTAPALIVSVSDCLCCDALNGILEEKMKAMGNLVFQFFQRFLMNVSIEVFHGLYGQK